MIQHTPGPYLLATNTETGLPVIVAKDGPCIIEFTEWSSTGKSDLAVVEGSAKFWLRAGNAYDGLVEALAIKLYQKFQGIHGAWEDIEEEYRKEYRMMAIGIAGETEKVE